MHGVIILTEVDGTGEAVRSNNYDGLPEIVRAFNSFSARRINMLRKMNGIPVWQRSYYEHIIRNDEDHAKIRQYIEGNPLLWEQDQENK
jgi:REP element-mobilizing transposase RayT